MECETQSSRNIPRLCVMNFHNPPPQNAGIVGGKSWGHICRNLPETSVWAFPGFGTTILFHILNFSFSFSETHLLFSNFSIEFIMNQSESQR
jgi:hypothetical protein